MRDRLAEAAGANEEDWKFRPTRPARPQGRTTGSRKSGALLRVLDGLGDVLQALRGVGEVHHGVVLVEELVAHAGEARA